MSSTHITSDRPRSRTARTAKTLASTTTPRAVGASVSTPISTANTVTSSPLTTKPAMTAASAPIANPMFARLQRRNTGGGRLAWIALPIGAVAVIGVIYATSQHGGQQAAPMVNTPPAPAVAPSPPAPAAAPTASMSAAAPQHVQTAATTPPPAVKTAHVAVRTREPVHQSAPVSSAPPNNASSNTSNSAMTPPPVNAPVQMQAPAESPPAAIQSGGSQSNTVQADPQAMAPAAAPAPADPVQQTAPVPAASAPATAQ